jgi:hypothetical protein
VRVGALAVTLNSAALVELVIQPRLRARWLLRMVNIEAGWEVWRERSRVEAIGQLAAIGIAKP